jgi:hypothetical protein
LNRTFILVVNPASKANKSKKKCYLVDDATDGHAEAGPGAETPPVTTLIHCYEHSCVEINSFVAEIKNKKTRYIWYFGKKNLDLDSKFYITTLKIRISKNKN